MHLRPFSNVTVILGCLILGPLWSKASVKDFNVGNGGDAVSCRRTGERFAGLYSLDYIATYNQRNDNSDIIHVSSWKQSSQRILSLLDQKSPRLATSFRRYLNDFENYDDLTRPQQWIEESFGLVDLNDESLLGRLPSNCGEVNAQKQVQVLQTVIRRESKMLIEFHVDRKIFNRLKLDAPLQFSFLAVHEWGWSLSDDVGTLRRFVRYLHSERAEKASREEFAAVLRTLGIALREEPVGKEWKDRVLSFNDSIRSALANANSACGSRIGFSLDSAAWERSPRSVLHCQTAVDAIGVWCSQSNTEVGKIAKIKEFVRKNVKTITCTYTNKTNARTISLAGGTLSYVADYDVLTNDQYIQNYLNNVLFNGDL